MNWQIEKPTKQSKKVSKPAWTEKKIFFLFSTQYGWVIAKERRCRNAYWNVDKRAMEVFNLCCNIQRYSCSYALSMNVLILCGECWRQWRKVADHQDNEIVFLPTPHRHFSSAKQLLLRSCYFYINKHAFCYPSFSLLWFSLCVVFDLFEKIFFLLQIVNCSFQKECCEIAKKRPETSRRWGTLAQPEVSNLTAEPTRIHISLIKETVW